MDKQFDSIMKDVEDIDSIFDRLVSNLTKQLEKFDAENRKKSRLQKKRSKTEEYEYRQSFDEIYKTFLNRIMDYQKDKPSISELKQIVEFPYLRNFSEKIRLNLLLYSLTSQIAITNLISYRCGGISYPDDILKVCQIHAARAVGNENLTRASIETIQKLDVGTISWSNPAFIGSKVLADFFFTQFGDFEVTLNETLIQCVIAAKENYRILCSSMYTFWVLRWKY